MTTSAHAIAKFIVQNSTDSVSNLKLQKLLYYVQGWHLGLGKGAAFSTDIQAWIHGPVVPTIFHHYREFKWTPIAVDSKPADVDAATAKHIKEVLNAYGKLSAAQLEALSHTEDPWREARSGLSDHEPSKNVISHESMKRYFGKLANG